MEKKCKNCWFWGRDYESVCDAPDWHESGDKIAPNSMAVEIVVDDDSGLYFKFVTGPEFGCTLFKEA
jgi:hypothetical protein